MPTLADILAFLSAVPTTTALIALVAATCALVAVRDWRLSVFALIVHYMVAGLLLTRVIRADIAMLKMLVGMMVCMTLYVTARRVSESQPAPATPNGEDSPYEEIPHSRLRLESGWLFRLLIALLGLAVASTIAARLVLPSAPREIILACSILFTQGLLALSVTDDPLKAGLGILTVIIGFDLFYSTIEQSLIVVGLLGLVNFSIALAIAYLTTLQASASSPEV